ncbi:hypothetical protein K470DRAFT_265811 [Piedraia hortae CBS 480.64]|uniref:Uncharacterized protein n=1 Tax=Piedraia hortae CBS 480.64 TaxID=1314780 RepID=A0A6A7BUB0_9PEZI|nr:hypothetical protein K470DRAFT_265811 [Piedraia hortae CBS 480.64]
MAEQSRLALLPGYDTAPDVYETPDLTDDTSEQESTPTLSLDENGEFSDRSAGEDNDECISHRRLQPRRARVLFGGKKEGYSRGGSGLYGEEESLKARIARLKREAVECQTQVQGRDEEGDMESLNRLLSELEIRGTRSRVPAPRPEQSEQPVADEQTLSRATDFDKRISALEKCLGVSSLDDPVPAAPVLHSLLALDEQFAALTAGGSLSSIEAASARVTKLRYDAEQLCSPSEDELLSAEDVNKLRQMFGLLGPLGNLAPTIPALMNRLRSLRTLHASAAEAEAELESVIQQQAEVDHQIKAWKEGLERVEKAVTEAEATNERNARVVESWVGELEERARALLSA